VGQESINLAPKAFEHDYFNSRFELKAYDPISNRNSDLYIPTRQKLADNTYTMQCTMATRNGVPGETSTRPWLNVAIAFCRVATQLAVGFSMIGGRRVKL
jgi:hypothetical protein